MGFVLGREENMVKMEKCWFPVFFFFSQCFLKLFPSDSLRLHGEDIILSVCQVFVPFLAHLSTTCSRGAFRVVRCSSVCRASSTISLNIFSFQTAGPIWTKRGRNVPWEVLFKKYSQNLIPSKTLVAMATKLNFLSNSLKIFFSETTGPILK